MPGMEIPQPGGTMKKMQFEFTDPATAAPQIPAGAGVPPAGAEGAIPPAGAQAPPQGVPAQDPMQGGMAPPQPEPTMFDQFGQGGDSSLFSDEDLMQLVGNEDPTMIAGDEMAMQADQDPMIQQQLMEAARRRLGGF